MNDFGKTIRELRLEHHLTQEFLAKELYTTQRRISYLELGKTEPDLYFLQQIADYFEVSIDFLLGRKDY
ncbi:MAG: helix-turn-helix transcriptional regulator [Clostridia bacterium]|nr:helix-turn-helix transcriptional regulator [Clostridia bacterium]